MRHPPCIALLAAVILCSACTPPPAAPDERLTVAVSIYPLAYIAGRVGGPDVRVAQATPDGVEPHDFEVTLATLASLEEAGGLVLNGDGVDVWAERAAPDVHDRGAFIVVASQGLDTLPAADGETIRDPHVWLDPVKMQTIAQRIADKLSAADPGREKNYRANVTALKADLQELDEEYRTGLTDCALHEIITSHAAFGYIADRYGFTQLAIAGMSPEDEPSPRRIAELADLAKSKGIGVIFFETLASPKLSETIASEIGATTAVLNPLEGLTGDDREQGKDYLSIMRDNLTQLRTALRCP